LPASITNSFSINEERKAKDVLVLKKITLSGTNADAFYSKYKMEFFKV